MYLDSVSKQICQYNGGTVRGSGRTTDTRYLTIDEAIDRLQRARTLIGGDKCLIACLVGSQMKSGLM